MKHCNEIRIELMKALGGREDSDNWNAKIRIAECQNWQIDVIINLMF